MNKIMLMLKAIADENRIKIVNELSKKEMCSCEVIKMFATDIPTLSCDMKILLKSGLISYRNEKNNIIYKINSDNIKMIEKTFRTLLINNERFLANKVVNYFKNNNDNKECCLDMDSIDKPCYLHHECNLSTKNSQGIDFGFGKNDDKLCKCCECEICKCDICNCCICEIIAD